MLHKFTGCIVVPSSYADVKDFYSSYKSNPYHVGDTRVDIFHVKPLSIPNDSMGPTIPAGNKTREELVTVKLDDSPEPRAD